MHISVVLNISLNYFVNEIVWWHYNFIMAVARGWEQLEVTCNPFVDISNNVLWNVEGNINPKREW